MTPIKQILSQFKSLYEAGKHYDIHPQQLKRWADAGAKIDDDGQVWVKAKGVLNQYNVRVGSNGEGEEE
jgi:citrate lyase alpha subunit